MLKIFGQIFDCFSYFHIFQYCKKNNISKPLAIFKILEDTARYAGLLLAPAEAFGQGIFLPFGQKNNLLCYLVNFRQFQCPVVTLVTLKRIQKSPKKVKQQIQKIKKIQKKSKNLEKKSEKNQGKSMIDCDAVERIMQAASIFP